MERQLERIDGMESRLREKVSQRMSQGKCDSGRTQLDQQVHGCLPYSSSSFGEGYLMMMMAIRIIVACRRGNHGWLFRSKVGGNRSGSRPPPGRNRTKSESITGPLCVGEGEGKT